MGDFASNLKTIASAHKHAWLASERFADPKVYTELAKPGHLMAIKEAGFRHVLVDLPDFIGFLNDDLVGGRRGPSTLAKDIEASPTYSVHKSFAGNVTPAESIAALMLRAKEAGVELHFFGASSLRDFEGQNLNQLLEVQMAMKGLVSAPSMREAFGGLGSMNPEKRKFMEQQLKVPGSAVAEYAEGITADHMKQLHRAASIVQELPEGERALVVQQTKVALPSSLPQLLGAETIGRIEAKSLTSSRPLPAMGTATTPASGIAP